MDFITNRMTENDKLIVFVGRKSTADNLSCDLAMKGMKCQAIHGDREQCDREEALEDFKDGLVKILIATDVASRGIDVKDITCVLNYDFPRNIEEYVHRVGRTGRAGRTGTSITFMCREDWKHAQELISRSVNDHFATTQLDPRSHAQSLVRGWRGICELSIQISDTVAGDPRGSIAVQAVEEFIANAVRHAGATNIGVTLESASGGIVIRCHVNREWQARETLGLGTSWFETLAPGGIRVSEFPGRCEIELVIE